MKKFELKNNPQHLVTLLFPQTIISKLIHHSDSSKPQMKVILALFLIFAAASASFISDWKNCGSSQSSWTPLTLYTEKTAIVDKPIYVSICGRANVGFTAFAYSLVAKKWGLSLYKKNGNITPRVYEANQLFCIEYSFAIPSFVVGSFDLTLTAIDINGAALGCMQFDSSYLN